MILFGCFFLYLWLILGDFLNLNKQTNKKCDGPPKRVSRLRTTALKGSQYYDFKNFAHFEVMNRRNFFSPRQNASIDQFEDKAGVKVCVYLCVNHPLLLLPCVSGIENNLSWRFYFLGLRLFVLQPKLPHKNVPTSKEVKSVLQIICLLLPRLSINPWWCTLYVFLLNYWTWKLLLGRGLKVSYSARLCKVCHSGCIL